MIQRILDGPYFNPIRLELGRHVIPLLLAVLFIGVALGYTWAYKAFSQ